MNRTYRILLADDHTILRDGLAALLSLEPEFEIVGTFNNGRDAAHAVASLHADLAMMDLSMPGMDGFTAITEIRKRSLETKVLVLTVHKTEEYLRTALQAGASGYVLKDASRQELLMAIRTVLSGKTYLSPAVSDRIVSGFLGNGAGTPLRASIDWLTVRERQILKLIAEGKRNKEMARFLSVSIKTVEKHRANLMRKLNLHNASALVAFAFENHLVGTEYDRQGDGVRES